MGLFRPRWWRRVLHEKKSSKLVLIFWIWLLIVAVTVSRWLFSSQLHSSKDSCVCDPQDSGCVCINDVCYRIWKKNLFKQNAWHQELVLKDLSWMGGGGFGEVYEGKELCGEEELTFILKKVPMIHREEWEREVYFGRLLQGKEYIARYVRSGEEKGALWIVFHHEGRSLYDLMNEQFGGVAVGHSDWWIELRQNSRRWLNIVRQLCAALTVLRANGVVHRDIKPENVLLNDNDELRLIDFGSAIDETSLNKFYKEPAASNLQETSAYSPPEAWLNKERYARSFSCDVWSVGMVLLELKLGNLDCIHPTTQQEAALKGRENELSNPQLKENIQKLLGLVNICSDFFSHHHQLKAFLPSTAEGSSLERLKSHLKQCDDQKEGPTDKEVEFFLKVFQYDPSSRSQRNKLLNFGAEKSSRKIHHSSVRISGNHHRLVPPY